MIFFFLRYPLDVAVIPDDSKNARDNRQPCRSSFVGLQCFLDLRSKFYENITKRRSVIALRLFLISERNIDERHIQNVYGALLSLCPCGVGSYRIGYKLGSPAIQFLLFRENPHRNLCIVDMQSYM